MSKRRRILLAVAWSVAVAVLSFGGAGVVARGDNFPGESTRPELTWRYDRAMEPGIAAAEEEARKIAEATDKLADAARSTLTNLLGGRIGGVQEDLQRGRLWTEEMITRGDTVERLVAELPNLDSPELLSPTTRDRVAALLRVVEVTRPLPERWDRLEQATVPAVEVAGVLQAHDATVFEATQAGVREEYEEAMAILDEADARLAEVARLRDQLSGAVDVSILGEWIDRNRIHDEALRELYQALLDTSGRVTEEVRAAIEKYDRAKELLPPDTRALVVILGDIAVGGVTEAAIAVDTVRGSVAAALAALD